MDRSLVLCGVVLAGVATACRAQEQPSPASQPPSPGERRPVVRLELKDGRSSFALGEIVALELVFTGPAAGAQVNTEEYGDMAEDVSVTPGEGWFRSHGSSSHDYGSAEKLEDQPIRVPVLLNHGIVFEKPGHYEVTVTTHRLSIPNFDYRNGVQTANSVGIDITAPDEAAEAEHVRLLSSRIAVGTFEERDAAVLALGFLGGDAAIRAKVQWLRGVESDELAGNLVQDLLAGFASSRNLPLQLRLLEEDWRDTAKVPDSAILQALQVTRAFARRQTEDGWQMVVIPKNDPAMKLAQQERAADIHEIVLTLPARSGENRADTAYFLMEYGGLSAGDEAVVRPVVLQEFPHMPALAQAMLIETRWKDVRDPVLVPEIKAMLDQSGKRAYHHDALERLIELAPDEARPYVVREICDPRSLVPLSSMVALEAKTLPAVDACLAKQMEAWREGERLRPGKNGPLADQKMLLAARFGTEALLAAVRETYAAFRGKVAVQYEGTFLAYLLRYSPKEAVAGIEAVDPGFATVSYPIGEVFKPMGLPYPVELATWLEAKLANGTDDQAGSVAYVLSGFGRSEDLPLIERRLASLRRQWAGREAEVDNAEYTLPAGKAKMAEQNMVSALLGGAKIWTLTADQKQSLEAGCMTAQCRTDFRVERPTAQP